MSTDTYNPEETKARIRMTWRKFLAMLGVGSLLAVILGFSGHIVLWRPVMLSGLALSLATAARWDLHNHAWFWIIVGAFVAAHVVLISFVSWNSQWVPAALIAPAVIVDSILLLGCFQIAEKTLTKESSL